MIIWAILVSGYNYDLPDEPPIYKPISEMTRRELQVFKESEAYADMMMIKEDGTFQITLTNTICMWYLEELEKLQRNAPTVTEPSKPLQNYTFAEFLHFGADATESLSRMLTIFCTTLYIKVILALSEDSTQEIQLLDATKAVSNSITDTCITGKNTFPATTSILTSSKTRSDNESSHSFNNNINLENEKGLVTRSSLEPGIVCLEPSEKKRKLKYFTTSTCSQRARFSKN